MKKLIIPVLLISSFAVKGQTNFDPAFKYATYVSKHNAYQINYNSKNWQINTDSSQWDIEFHDSNNLLKAYFKTLNYFVPQNKLRQTIKSQYLHLGKVRALKVYKKQLKYMTVDYFECTLKYQEFIYKYEGFFFGGQKGSMELQFGGQDESIARNQNLIDEFCNGVFEIK